MKQITTVILFILFFFGLTICTRSYPKTLDLRKSGVKATFDDFEKIKEISLNLLKTEVFRNNLSENNISFEVLSVQIDHLGLSHTKVQQLYQGISILGSEAIIHLRDDNSLFKITNNIAVETEEIKVSVNPVISVEEAINKVFDFEKCNTCLVSKIVEPKLYIIGAGKSEWKKPKLIYRIQLDLLSDKKNPRLPVYYIDAKTGGNIFTYNNLQTQSSNNYGRSLYNEWVNFTTYNFNQNYFLEDLNRKFGTFEGRWNGTDFDLIRYTDFDGIWGEEKYHPAINIHWGAEKTIDYYKNIFGRNGINGFGGPLTYPSIGDTYILPLIYLDFDFNGGASWTGNSAIFGKGDGLKYNPFVAIDIVGHELTHGVIESSAGLNYFRQSGSLNESFADIFGCMTERYALGENANYWRQGEDIIVGRIPNLAVRFLHNPHLDGRSIDHFSEYSDNLDIHYNSGLANKAFYLLSVGGSHHLGGSMNGIGTDKASAIWYYALTNFMTSTTNFADARIATVDAAGILFGTTEADAVARAWCLVGVGACTTNGTSITYQSSLANIGWQDWRSDGETSGTTGQSRQIEAVRIKILPNSFGVGVTYRTHLAEIGWQNWTANGEIAGTTGQSRRMEAVQIKLINNSPICHVNYRAYVKDFGWLPWVSDGATAGTTGQSRRMEALEAKVQCQ